MIVVGVEIPGAVAVDADLLDAIARPVADHRDVACLAELALQVAFAEAAIAVGVERPDAVVEGSDAADAGAGPIADDSRFQRDAVMEDVIDKVFANFTLLACLQPTAAERGLIFGRRQVLLALGDKLVRRIGEAWVGLNRLWIARPGAAKNADVGFAISIPVADDWFVVARAELGPQVAGVPVAVAVEIDEPLAVNKEA